MLLCLASFRYDLRLARTIGFRTEKRHRTIAFVQKFKTSSFDIVVREPLGFRQKWSSEPWLSHRKHVSNAYFRFKTQWASDIFDRI